MWSLNEPPGEWVINNRNIQRERQVKFDQKRAPTGLPFLALLYLIYMYMHSSRILVTVPSTGLIRPPGDAVGRYFRRSFPASRRYRLCQKSGQIRPSRQVIQGSQQRSSLTAARGGYTSNMPANFTGLRMSPPV